ncbi:MAG: signal peptidase II [Terrimicrobiaceae bacterium]
MKSRILYLTLPLYIADQTSKLAVLRSISPEDLVPVIPGFFNLVNVANTGAAFGMLKGASTFFALLSVVAIVVISVLIRRGAFSDGLSRTAAALLLAGVLGNLTDRLLHGHVVDFLDFILPWYGRWPAFNVADSCICIAAGLFLIAAFKEGHRTAGETA